MSAGQPVQPVLMVSKLREKPALTAEAPALPAGPPVPTAFKMEQRPVLTAAVFALPAHPLAPTAFRTEQSSALIAAGRARRAVLMTAFLIQFQIRMACAET